VSLDLKPPHVILRVLADLANIHACMIATLAIAVLYPFGSPQTAQPQWRADEAVHYYRSSFLLLSLLFPAVFWLNGFYTRSRTYTGWHRPLVVLRGLILSVLLFACINFALFQRQQASQNYVILFCGMALVAATLPRLAKAALLEHMEVRPKRAARPFNSDGVVLVLGGAGYIGSCLVRRLLTIGRRVRVMDSLIYGDYALHDVIGHPKFELRVGDCRKLTDLVAAVKGADSIVHLAAIVGDPACEIDPQTSREINYAATRMLIEVAKGNGNCRLVFASSCSVYGATDILMNEYSNVAPVSLYGRTKVDSEDALLEAHSSSFHPIILRLATVFGLSYRTRFDLIVNLLSGKACSEGMITIFNGTQWRPFIHVQDVASGIVQVLEMPLDVVSGEVYNLGDSRMNFTLAQVAEKVLAAFPSTRVEYVENADRRNYRVSFEKVRNQVGFECGLTLEDGIHEIKGAFESKLIVDYTDARYSNQKFLKLCGTPLVRDELDRHLMAALANVPAPARKSASPVFTSMAAPPKH
jgi:nucleoside-diphosphate-sugar epimerase